MRQAQGGTANELRDQPTCNRTRNRRTNGATITKPPRRAPPPQPHHWGLSLGPPRRLRSTEMTKSVRPKLSNRSTEFEPFQARSFFRQHVADGGLARKSTEKQNPFRLHLTLRGQSPSEPNRLESPHPAFLHPCDAYASTGDTPRAPPVSRLYERGSLALSLIRSSGETRAHRSPSARTTLAPPSERPDGRWITAFLTVRRLLYSNDSFHSFSSAEFCSAYQALSRPQKE